MGCPEYRAGSGPGGPPALARKQREKGSREMCLWLPLMLCEKWTVEAAGRCHRARCDDDGDV